MLCENCNERPATYHVVEITDNGKNELHLCEKCAHEKNIALPPSLSLNEILGSLMEAHAEKDAPELANTVCPNCGITYAEFRRGGRLGCPQDYTVFEKGMVPFLERIQGATSHTGKTPKEASHDSAQTAELIKLRRELNAAIANERYEEAARLRDSIKTLRKEE